MCRPWYRLSRMVLKVSPFQMRTRLGPGFSSDESDCLTIRAYEFGDLRPKGAFNDRQSSPLEVALHSHEISWDICKNDHPLRRILSK
jgi:hypothetical protein